MILRTTALVVTSLAGWIAAGPAAAAWETVPVPAELTADAFADPATPVNVALELALLVDASSSVDDTEFALQQQGYAEAFRDADVQAVVLEGGGIAVRYVLWSSANVQRTFGWMQITSVNDCLRFADAIEAMGRPARTGTFLASAVHETLYDMEHNNYVSGRQVIDVSGDGKDANQSFMQSRYAEFKTLDAADDAARGDFHDEEDNDYYFPIPRADFVSRIGSEGTDAVFADVVGLPWSDVMALRPETTYINGISIGSDAWLQAWYETDLPQGDGAFAMHAGDFTAFGAAIKQKLIREISEEPAPMSYD